MRKPIAAWGYGAALVLVAGLLAPGGRAAMLTDWTASDVITITDVLGDADHLSRDITKLYFRSVGPDVFFRLDIGTAPVQQAGQYAPEYSIDIDFPNGQGGGPNPALGGSNYIAENVGTTIDTLVVSHYTLASGFIAHHRHVYLGPLAPPPRVDTDDLVSALGGAWDHSEGGGAILQWRLPVAELVYENYSGGGGYLQWTGGPFTIY
ncbi:MAG: hypothetical protein AB1716_17005, partial [Planctomycetota bacterium]